MDSDHEQPSSDNNQQPTTQAATRVPGKTTKGNGKVGEANYSREELLYLLVVMERILPIGTMEWDQVLLEHSEQYPGRDVESIQHKYIALYRENVPTPGAPNVPPEVLLAAKRVKFKIGVKADIGGAEGETFDLETGFGRSSFEAHEQDDDVPISGTQPSTIAPARRPAQQQSAPATTTISSRVSRRQEKDANQEFLELWRMKMAMELEERRMEMAMDREERRQQHRQERRDDRRELRENRKRQNELAGLVTALVGGIATYFGVELPLTHGNKKRKQHNNIIDSPDNSSD